jgi:hypothetical protein
MMVRPRGLVANSALRGPVCPESPAGIVTPTMIAKDFPLI